MAAMLLLSFSTMVNASGRCSAKFKVHHKRGNPLQTWFSADKHARNNASYSWNFGDNSSDSSANPSHLYAAPGTYNVCLTVTTFNATGDTICSDTECKSILISAVSCNAAFNAHAGQSLNVKLKAARNHHGSTYVWTFGDGTSDTSSTGKGLHTYAAAGTYNVCLTVTDSSNGTVYCSATWCDSVTVSAPAPASCEAQFRIHIKRNGEVEVKGGHNAHGATYSWNFGDGTIVTGTSNDGSHIYSSPGTYNVCLTVTDSANGVTNCTASWCDSITIGPVVIAVCDADFTHHNRRNSLTETFKAKQNKPGTIYAWTFGDGDTSSAKNPAHTYQSAGNFQVCLTVTLVDTGGKTLCTATYCDSISAGNLIPDDDRTTLREMPSASVSPNPLNEISVLHIANMSGSVTLKVFEHTGKIMLEKKGLANGDVNLGSNLLPAGFYIYRLSDSNNNVVEGKLIVQ